MDRKMVNFIKEQYPPGTRIRLNAMDDPYAPILPGTEGEVDFVDDAGQLHMKWDNGRTLPLAPGEDSFTVLPPKLTTLKLYMPLTADLYERNEYGEFDDIKECSNVLLRELRFLPIHSRKLFEYYRDFVAHKEVYFQNVQAEIECLGDRSCFTEE